MSMDKPDAKYPNTPLSVPSAMPTYNPDPSIRGVNFDQLLMARGIRVIHEKAVPCPNVLSVDAAAHQPNCEFCDNSGIYYYTEKEIVGLFTGNSIEKTFEAHGVWEIGTAVMTFPSMYPDGTQADFNTYDYLTIPDFEVRMWEQKVYQERPGLLQTLRYPVTKVELAVSIVSDVQKIYLQGVDFNITPAGDIQWVAGREPGINPANGEGVVVTWSYFANPRYIVVQSLRELRITQEMIQGQKTARRLPQQVLVKRDFLVGAGEKLLSGEVD